MADHCELCWEEFESPVALLRLTSPHFYAVHDTTASGSSSRLSRSTAVLCPAVLRVTRPRPNGCIGPVGDVEL